MIGHRETPEYNYGLSGKGKINKKIWKKHQPKEQIRTEGEVVFGTHPVSLALASHHRQHFFKLYIDSRHRQAQASKALSKIQKLAEQRGVPVEFVPKNVLMYLSGNRPHQGVCLDASARVLPELDPEMLHGAALSSDLLWLLLYNVQDPMNFGAILRSSFFLDVDRVIVPKVNSCALSPVVSKASAGALEVTDIYQVDSTYRSLRNLTQTWQTCGGQVIGTASICDPRQQVVSLQDFTAKAPTLLIVGNEGSGVDEDVLDLCDTLLTIPPPSIVSQTSSHTPVPAVESLNVSVATGILIHWLRASRKNSR
ncbi:hypothetical protein V1264_012063 [Littorina saxatilis]